MTVLLDETHDPARTSWVASARGHEDFPIQNLPLGSFSWAGRTPHGGMRIGDAILDLKALAESGILSGDAARAAEAATGETLNPLLALGSVPRRALRRAVSALLSDPAHETAVAPLLRPAEECRLHLPARIGDYTDFYVGIHHATNVGRLLRPDSPLMPNYKHIPIGYHGRASSVRVSGTPVRRPYGQTKPAAVEAPIYGPTRRLDYELELGVWIGPGNALGTPIPIAEAAEHIAGLTLLNDWSARDIQGWEYQPLGPFLAKNFLTSVSPWIVTAEALAPFRRPQVPRPSGDPQPLPYLSDPADQDQGAFAVALEAFIASRRMRDEGLAPWRLSRGSAEGMYWTVAQMIAHHTVNGCDLNPGDLLGTGTLSTASEEGFGSLLEISRAGRSPVTLPTGETRSFLENGDELILAGRFHAEGFVSVGFGTCRGTVEPAL